MQNLLNVLFVSYMLFLVSQARYANFFKIIA